jgi:hypothetical protein
MKVKAVPGLLAGVPTIEILRMALVFGGGCWLDWLLFACSQSFDELRMAQWGWGVRV